MGTADMKLGSGLILLIRRLFWKVSPAVLSVKTDLLPDNENSLPDAMEKKRQVLLFRCTSAKTVRKI
jgi:hypothetical protein